QLLRGARLHLDAAGTAQGVPAGLRPDPALQACRRQPRSGDPRAGGGAAPAAQPDSAERFAIRLLRQPLAGDGELRVARQRGADRPARTAQARLIRANKTPPRRGFVCDAPRMGSAADRVLVALETGEDLGLGLVGADPAVHL